MPISNIIINIIDNVCLYIILYYNCVVGYDLVGYLICSTKIKLSIYKLLFLVLAHNCLIDLSKIRLK